MINGSRLIRYWEAIYAAHDPGQGGESWEIGGVSWSRERHLFWGGSHSFRIEFHTLVRLGSRPWRLLVGKELFWGQDRRHPIKDTAWCKVDKGKAADVAAWMEANLPAGYGRARSLAAAHGEDACRTDSKTAPPIHPRRGVSEGR